MLLDSNKYMNALWAAHHVHNGQHGDAGLQQHAQRGGERRAWLHCVQLPHLPPVPPLLALPRSQRMPSMCMEAAGKACSYEACRVASPHMAGRLGSARTCCAPLFSRRTRWLSQDQVPSGSDPIASPNSGSDDSDALHLRQAWPPSASRSGPYVLAPP